MAMNKLERIEKDIEKTKGKIAELQKQLRELEAAKTEQENLQIVQLVRGPLLPEIQKGKSRHHRQ